MAHFAIESLLRIISNRSARPFRPGDQRLVVPEVSKKSEDTLSPDGIPGLSPVRTIRDIHCGNPEMGVSRNLDGPSKERGKSSYYCTRARFEICLTIVDKMLTQEYETEKTKHPLN